jgi:hypothetical protein
MQLMKLAIILFISSSIHAAYAAIDSTQMAPQTTTQRKLCYTLVIDGVTVSGTPQFFTSWINGFCVPVGSGITANFGALGGPQAMTGFNQNLGVSCPAAFPYVLGYTKNWGSMNLVWILPPIFSSSATSANVWCCSTPLHLSSMTSSWETPDASGRCSSGI